jgi:hypothetical protein
LDVLEQPWQVFLDGLKSLSNGVHRRCENEWGPASTHDLHEIRCAEDSVDTEKKAGHYRGKR